MREPTDKLALGVATVILVALISIVFLGIFPFFSPIAYIAFWGFFALLMFGQTTFFIAFKKWDKKPFIWLLGVYGFCLLILLISGILPPQALGLVILSLLGLGSIYVVCEAINWVVCHLQAIKEGLGKVLQNNTGRPRFAADEWAREQYHHEGRSAQDIFPEWFEKAKGEDRDFRHPKKSFNKLLKEKPKSH